MLVLSRWQPAQNHASFFRMHRFHENQAAHDADAEPAAGCRPDTMFSFDHATGVMYTCDAFGAHYATGAPFDTGLASLTPHFRFYYDCLMRPNARSVLTALRKVKDLDYTTIATGHGPIIRYNLDELVGRRVSQQSSRLCACRAICSRLVYAVEVSVRGRGLKLNYCLSY